MKRAVIQSSILLVAAHAALVAGPLDIVGTQGALGFSAVFQNLGSGILQITLSNTGTTAPTDESGVLAALFFNIDGNPALVPQSVLLGTDSAVVNGTGDPSYNWQYATGLSGPGGTTQGISAAGFGLFSRGNFCGSANCGNKLKDSDWGLVDAAYVPASGNPSIAGNPLIQTSAIFVLSGIAAGFDPSTAISDVRAQYSASLIGVNATSLLGSDPALAASASTPEPGTFVLIGSGLMVFALRRRART